MNRPLLSVVIPTYNRMHSLGVTLEGLARQNFPAEHFEVLVISDGSTDGTGEFLRSYTASSPFRLHAITQENSGPACARNRGVREASGSIIVFLDDDVEPKPQFLSRHYCQHEHRAGRTDLDGVVVIGPMRSDPMLRWAEPCWIAWEHAMLERQYRNWETGVWAGTGPNHFYSGNASAMREQLQAVGGFDEGFKRQEDVDLAYRLDRRFHLRWIYDSQAGGVHRPQRTFSSWLKVPFAYGQLDVVRVRRGDLPVSLVQEAYTRRHRLSRILADAVFLCPPFSSPSRAALLAIARLAHGCRLSSFSRMALSAIYNVHYLEGVCSQVGGPRQFRGLLTGRAGTLADASSS